MITEEKIDSKSGQWKTFYGYDDMSYKRSWNVWFGDDSYCGKQITDLDSYYRDFINFGIDPEVHEDGSVTFDVYCGHPEVPTENDGFQNGFKSLKEAMDWCEEKTPERFKVNGCA
jgi:hypothetical protein